MAVSSRAEATSHDHTDIGPRSHPSSGKVSASKETLDRERVEGASGGSGGDSQGTKTDEELWARLEELEREEEEQVAKERKDEEVLDDVTPGSVEKKTGTSKGEGASIAVSRTQKPGAVRGQKASPKGKPKEVPSCGSSRSTAGVPVSAPLRISVKHTPSQPVVESANPKKVSMHY